MHFIFVNCVSHTVCRAHDVIELSSYRFRFNTAHSHQLELKEKTKERRIFMILFAVSASILDFNIYYLPID